MNWPPLALRLPDAVMTRINDESPPGGWFVTRTSPPHMVPVRDLRAHRCGGDCACKPVDDGEVVVHNAFDGRERYERGRAARH